MSPASPASSADRGVKARHRLDKLLASLLGGDELFVTELDRLGRSTGEAIVMMDELIRRGVALRVLALPSLDITTNDGRLIADILASLAEDERPADRRGPHQAGRRRAVRVVARAYGVTDKTLRATLARRTG